MSLKGVSRNVLHNCSIHLNWGTYNDQTWKSYAKMWYSPFAQSILTYLCSIYVNRLELDASDPSSSPRNLLRWWYKFLHQLLSVIKLNMWQSNFSYQMLRLTQIIPQSFHQQNAKKLFVKMMFSYKNHVTTKMASESHEKPCTNNNTKKFRVNYKRKKNLINRR